ncbi:VirD4-like conjugal transfer protein, CD1115 family [Vallitalea longa]|nr:type IV secretory system conjugative DNA transfer family protein [Vallitalea longa]
MECIRDITTDKKHLLLFLCLQGFVLIIAVFYYLANNKPYQSELIEITPDIKTPVPAGQNQFGSAKWLENKDSGFKSFALNPNDKDIKTLITNGCDDIKNKEREDKNEQEKNKEKLYKSKNDKVQTKGAQAKENSLCEKACIPRGGLVLGYDKLKGNEKIYYIDDDVHTLCIGATRSGKTRAVVLQTIGTLALSGESMVISDPKGELMGYTVPYLRKMGYKVITIDFKNPLKSTRYNFLQPIIDAVDEDDIPKAIDKTWDLTSQLVGEAKGERIWTDGEASIIASSIMAVVYDNRGRLNKKYQNMTNVYYFISEMCKSINGKMPLLEYIKTLKQSHPAKGLLSISEVAPNKTRGSFYTAALTTLRLFTNPLINSMTYTSDYDPQKLGEEKTALFIVLPDEKTTYYSLASLLVSQHYELLVNEADKRGGRLKKRVNFVLDEYGNFVKIADFGAKLTVGGGRGIRFNLFVQSFAQIDEKYGKEVAKTIKSNCENWIYLQADDLETLEEISKKLGNYTVSTYTLSASHGKYSTPSSSHSLNLTSRALLTPDEVRLIKRPYSLVISRNNPVMMYSPDLSKWSFNKIFGLGDKEHNRLIREQREKMRKERIQKTNEIDLWNIWLYFKVLCEQPKRQVSKELLNR